MTLSGKSSLILGENKAAFCREGQRGSVPVKSEARRIYYILLASLLTGILCQDPTFKNDLS